MRLKCIKLVGFKSFADATTVNFPTNMSAVIGPNGCGKSNIIDAVRWVMGESSAKHLRGESMADVIFNGSGGRKPVGQASIELVFDNTQNKLGGEYAAFNEISVKRAVTRDGQSDYFLNAAKCRRRDITDIFLGTGLGPRSYAIIEQGMISRLIEAKPEELRVFIEEAAGISKYKERRRDTENRMRRTRENLERLQDIRDELTRQLNRLKRQANAAERYKALKEEERNYKAQYQALQWQRFNEQSKTKQAAISQQELKVEESVTLQVSINSNMEELTETRIERNDVLSKVQAEFYTYGAEIARLEQVIQNQKERQTQLHTDAQQVSENIESLQLLLDNDQNQLAQWEEELQDVEPNQELLQEKQQESAQVLQETEQAMQGLQQEWDTFNAQAGEEQRKADVEQSRVQHYEQVLQNVKQRIDNLSQEESQLLSGPVEQEIAQLLEQVDEFELRLTEFDNNSETFKQTMDELREAIHGLQKSLNEKRSELEKMQGRFASLEALQQVALGQKNNSIQSWLEKYSLDTRPRLAQKINVNAGYEIAVETVLGDYLQAVCVDDLNAVEGWVDQLDQGSVTLIDTKSAATNSRNIATSLAEKVSGDANALSLLENIYVADDLSQALALRSQLNAQESVVTKQGVWLGASWLRVSKQVDEKTGVLARQQEMQDLEKDIDTLTQQVHSLESEHEQKRQSLSDIEVQYQEQQAQRAVESRQHADLRSQLSAQQVKVEQIKVRKQRLQDENEQLQMQFNDQESQLKGTRRDLEIALENMAKHSEERERLIQAREQNREALNRAREQAEQDKNTAMQSLMRAQSLTSQISNVRNNIQRVQEQLAQLKLRQEAIEHERANSSNPDFDYQNELEVQLEKRLESDQKLQKAREALNEVEHQIREQEQKRQQADVQTQRLRSELEQQRLAAQEVRMRCSTLVEQLEASNHVLDDVLKSLPEEAAEDKWQQEIERLANSISRLGPINLAAIDEFEIESERKIYLDQQFEDLTKALETLEAAIKKIDKETKERFKQTFDSVNSGLQELFPKVFGGGSAGLELTDDDLLNTGVLIKARPPGKRNSTIHLLSGGEKALTAIALVFSIFRLNPAPFCILDEVDAPLDDANVGRYANLVKEMSDQVQFIYITHNKISMEKADQLLGVTMHEPGVSRMVAVDVEEAVQMVAV